MYSKSTKGGLSVKKVLTVFLATIFLLSSVCSAAAMPAIEDFADSLDELGFVETDTASDISQADEISNVDADGFADADLAEIDEDYDDVDLQSVPADEITYHKTFDTDDSTVSLNYGKDIEWGGGAAQSSFNVGKKDVDGDGVEEGCLSVTSNTTVAWNTRVKLLNVFNSKTVTPRDIGATYEITMRVYNPDSAEYKFAVATYGGKVFKDNNYAQIVRSANGGFAASQNSTNAKSFTLPPKQWSDITYTATLYKLSMDELALEEDTLPKAGNPRPFYLDEITVRKTSSIVADKDPSDLQDIFNSDNVKLTNANLVSGRYELENGGSIKFGSEYSHTNNTTSLPETNTAAERFVAEKGSAYAISMRAKVPEGKMEIRANSALVDRTFQTTEENQDYPIIYNDDFTLTNGNGNVVLMKGSKSGEAKSSATMPATGDDFEDITIIYQDTGMENARNYFGKEQDILRALDIYSTGDGNVIESFKVSKIDDINEFLKTVYFPGNFDGWKSADGFDVTSSSIKTLAGEGKELTYAFKGMEGKSVEMGYTASLSAAATSSSKLPYIAICDKDGKVLGVSLISSEAAKTGKIIANVPVATSAGNTCDLIVKVVSGSEEATITNMSLDAFADTYSVSKSMNDNEQKLTVTADFADINVPSNFEVAVMKPGKTVNDLNDSSNILSKAALTSSGAVLDLSSLTALQETLNIVIYNEEKAIYLLDSYEFKNANFVAKLLDDLSKAASKDEIKSIIETYDDANKVTYSEVLELNKISYYKNANSNDLDYIYSYIFNGKAKIVDSANKNNTKNLHNLVYNAAFVLTVKSAASKFDFVTFLNDTKGLMDYTGYTKLFDAETYTSKFFAENIMKPAAKMVNTGIVTAFEDTAKAIIDLMNENIEYDSARFPFRSDFENGLPENTIERRGLQAPSYSVTKASAFGIVDHTTGTGDGSMFVYAKNPNGTGRIKIANVFNPNGLTPKDLGSTFRVSFWVNAPQDCTIANIGTMSVKNFAASGSISVSADSKYSTSFKDSKSVSVVGNTWTKVEMDIKISTLLTESFGIEGNSSSDYYFIDDFVVERIDDARPEINENDLQPLTNTAAVKTSNVTKTSDGYVFSNGGKLTYGMGSNDARMQRYIAEKDSYYQISMVAKTTKDGLKLTGNSVNVYKVGATASQDDYTVKDQDDFSLAQGDANETVISCEGSVAANGSTMIDTNGEFKNINIWFKDTGIKDEIKYLGKSIDILRSINVEGLSDGNVIKSMVITKLDSTGSIRNGSFENTTSFYGWDSADNSAFEYGDGTLVINSSAANNGKTLMQLMMLSKNTIYELGFTAVSGTGDATIEVVDGDGNILGKTKIAPVKTANAEKLVVFATPDSELNAVPVTVKIIAGSDGKAVIDNVRMLKENDEAYIDIEKYTPFTKQYMDGDQTFRESVIMKALPRDAANSEEILSNICDEIITLSLEAEEFDTGIYRVIDDNSEYLGLTNWSKVEALKGTKNYKDAQTNIANYVRKNGIKDLNKNIPSLLPKSDKTTGGGGGGGKDTSLPTTITNNNTTNNNTNNNDVTFTDLDLAPWASESILSLAKKGAISGYEDGTFRPNNNITRAEFAKLLVSAFGVEDKTATCSFNDVSTFDWYYTYVATLEKLGAAKGMGSGAFGVNDYITRQDMVVLIVRMAELLGKPINATTSEITFADNDSIASYAAEAVKILQRAGIVSGLDENNFGPLETATRAQVAKILNALIG